jgi:tRNA 2-thiocytidine biosynthesis protein TtcA
MIKDGDKLMLGLSGGKDSMSLLHCLLDIQRRAPIKFSLAACTVDPQAPGFRPEPLKQYLAKLGVPYFFESQPIIELASKQPKKVTSICAWCSRMKRGILYSTARREGYNVLVLGQHLDDMVRATVSRKPLCCFCNFANITVAFHDIRRKALSCRRSTTGYYEP